MPLLVVLLFHETVDLPSVQIRVILRVSVRMPGRLLGLMGWSYDVGRRKASRVRRNGHVHSAIARRQSTPWALQSPPESCHFFPNSRPAIFRPCLFRNNIRRGVGGLQWFEWMQTTVRYIYCCVLVSFDIFGMWVSYRICGYVAASLDD